MQHASSSRVTAPWTHLHPLPWEGANQPKRCRFCAASLPRQTAMRVMLESDDVWEAASQKLFDHVAPKPGVRWRLMRFVVCFRVGGCLGPGCDAVARWNADEGCSTWFQTCGETAYYQQARHRTMTKGEMAILQAVFQLVNFLKEAADFNPYSFSANECCRFSSCRLPSAKRVFWEIMICPFPSRISCLWLISHWRYSCSGCIVYDIPLTPFKV